MDRIMKNLQKGLEHNSFEDNDTSLDEFPYMSGYKQTAEKGKIMMYKWNEQKGENERVWVDVKNI